MSVAEEPAGTTMTTMAMIDEAYEFSAPRFFDFTKEESEEEMQKAELWFESALSYAPSRTLFFFFDWFLLKHLDQESKGLGFLWIRILNRISS